MSNSNFDIAMRAMMEVQSKAVTVPPGGWRWAPGVILFPEVKCPWCKTVIRSKAIWKVGKTELYGQFIPRRGVKPKLIGPNHPHVRSASGAICFGNAKDANQALFFSFDPGSVYFDLRSWFRGEYWEHRECVYEEEEEDDDSWYCEGCEETQDSDTSSYTYGTSMYCTECFDNVAFVCDACTETCSNDERRESPIDGGSYCSDCWSYRYFQCNDCNTEGAKDDCRIGLDDKNYCEECWDKKYFQCSACSDHFDLDDRTVVEDGTEYCNDCAPEDEPEDDDDEEEVTEVPVEAVE